MPPPEFAAGDDIAGVVAAGVEPAAEGEAALWANAEVARKTAGARRIRKDVLFIGSVELLGNIVPYKTLDCAYLGENRFLGDISVKTLGRIP